MANRYFTQWMYTLHKAPVMMDVDIVFGAAGAIASFKGAGIANVTKQTAAGTFLIQLQDNYTQFFGMAANVNAAPSGAGVAGGAFVVGTTYRILTLGTTTQAQWTAAGVLPGITAQVGTVFVAATTGAGTGTVQVLVTSGIARVEVLGDPTLTLGPSGLGPNLGGYIFIATYDNAGALVNPVVGSTLGLVFYLSNSSAFINGIS